MKYLLPFFVILIFANCGDDEKPKAKKAASITEETIVAASVNYDSCKKQVIIFKQKNKAKWAALAKAQKEKIITTAITETIIPAWIGTKWDFNGISETPQKGYIACGYFVTTVLRDAGFNIARIKLAQCASEQMITALVQPKYIQRFSNNSMEDFTAAVGTSGYGLYIVGLDNHTGFIYNNGKDIYFIHSTFVGTRNVQSEKAINSIVLKQSRYKVLAKLSADENMLNKWIN